MSTRRTVAAFLISTGAAIAQVAETDSKPLFEVASIRQAAPGSPAYRMGLTFVPGGRFTVTNYTLKELIELAWEIQPFRISGGPAWIDSVRYNVSAKADSDADARLATLSSEQQRLEQQHMLQVLLADRFKLRVHWETKERRLQPGGGKGRSEAGSGEFEAANGR